MISATAEDQSVIEGVQFYVDGIAFGGEDSVMPFELTLDTLILAEGAHTIQARARDEFGNIGESSVVTITIDNIADGGGGGGGGGNPTPVDSTAPTVSISAPSRARP